MIDLTIPIRNKILADATITNLLPNYLGSKSVFSRTPVPSDAPYPMIVISPVVSDLRKDFLNKKQIKVTHYIGIWGSNDSPSNYRNVKTLAERVSTILDRVEHFDPKVITSIASQPFYSSDNDLENGKNSLVKMGFVVSVDFTCIL